MRFLVVGDLHFSEYTSILRKRGEEHSIRLENCIESVNWVESEAFRCKADIVVYLGDFFDTSELSAECITAFSKIHWCSDVQHFFLVGNHETARADLSYNSANMLQSVPKSIIVDSPMICEYEGTRALMLPYIFESERKPIKDYLSSLHVERVDLIFSHNDIKDVQYGKFKSQSGFSISELESSALMTFNGHIHNSEYITSKIMNVGNLTGQNFNEDGRVYPHRIVELDIFNDKRVLFQPEVKATISHMMNPHAIYFYKADVMTKNDIGQLLEDISLNKSVLSIRCKESLQAELRQTLDAQEKVIEYRITVIPETVEVESNMSELLSVDPIAQFKQYIINELGSSDLVVSELEELSK